jgi:hypothetical protein
MAKKDTKETDPDEEIQKIVDQAAQDIADASGLDETVVVEVTELPVEEPQDVVPIPQPVEPQLTLDQFTQQQKLQVDYPHDEVLVEWDEDGWPTFVTPDGKKHKAKQPAATKE